MHTARTHESRYWQKFLLQDFKNTCMLHFSPGLFEFYIASCCANNNALCQHLLTSYDFQNCVLASHATLTYCGVGGPWPFFWQLSLPLPPSSSFSLQQSSLTAKTHKSINSCIKHARRCQRTWLCMAPKPVKMMFNFVGFICHCHKHMSQCLQFCWSSPNPWTPTTTKRWPQQAMLTITSLKISNALCVGWTSYVIP